LVQGTKKQKDQMQTLVRGAEKNKFRGADLQKNQMQTASLVRGAKKNKLAAANLPQKDKTQGCAGVLVICTCAARLEHLF
jgi:hypothetical protein